MEKIAVLPNEKKQQFLYDYLVKMHCPADLVSNFNLSEYKYIAGTTPFFKNRDYINCELYSSFPATTFVSLLRPGQILFGGGFSDDFLALCRQRQVTVIDLLKYPDFTKQNCYYTAEGLLGIIICHTDFSLKDANILVLGNGKCGSEICALLKKLDANVFFYDNNPDAVNSGQLSGYQFVDIYKDTHLFSSFHLVVNTVPKPLLSRIFLQLLPKECVLFDIASYPFGFDKEIADFLSLKLYTCSAIPGKYMTRDSGELLAKNILSFIEGTM